MALNGALADLGVVDLLQFPHTGRKTGELVIAGDANGGKAHLFYAKGKLVHASLGPARGMPVLVEVLGWVEGRFEFKAEVVSPETSIELDLHRAIMQAIKTRDEQKEDARKRAAERPASGIQAVTAVLQQFVASSSYAVHACLLDAKGAPLAQASAGSPPEKVDALRSALRALLGAYPRGGLKRIFVEDEQGTVVLVRLSSGAALVVVAAKGSPTGMVSVWVGKLAAALEEKVEK